MVDEIMTEGSRKAEKIAQATMAQVRDALHIVY
jgi:hypothetical protein